jgi:nitrate reductase gamma subunit
MYQLFQSLPLVPPEFRAFFYGMAGLAVAVFLVGTLDRVWLWRLGRDRPGALTERTGTWGLLRLSFVKLFSADCLLARRTFARSRVRGVMLVCILWGSLGLLAGVVFSAATYLAAGPLFGYGIRRVLAFLMDVAGSLLLAGLLVALARRYLFRPTRWVSVRGDGMVLVLFTLVVVLGFGMKGVRLAGLGVAALVVSPVGGAFGLALGALAGGDTAALAAIYPTLYLLHAGTAFALLAYVPFSRLFHLFATQITMFAAREEADRRLRAEARGSRGAGEQGRRGESTLAPQLLSSSAPQLRERRSAVSGLRSQRVRPDDYDKA